MYDDGSGPALYVGGVFTVAGGLTARHIARWDGSNWAVLWTGVESTSVNALAVFGSPIGQSLYVGGNFRSYDTTTVEHMVALNPDGSLD